MTKPHTLIVGGTRGIGRALVRVLADENHVLSVIGRRPASDQDQGRSNVSYWCTDVANQKQLLPTLDEIIHTNGKLHNLVFLQRYRGTGDDWIGEIEATLTATRHVIDHSAREFSDTNGKAIVIVSSIASHFIAAEQPLSYHIAKAGLNQMIRYYAVELGPKGIRVNGVSPSTILKDESKNFYLQNEQLLKLYKDITPLGRMGSSDEIAQVIAFLCSQKASFITGQNIIVDGGVSLQGHEALARQLTSMGRPKVSSQANETLT